MNVAAEFFDYHCADCDAPYCERVGLMNLALDITEDGYCLACLCARQDVPQPDLLETLIPYIHSRDCFKNPWQKFDASPCPLLPQGLCPCQ